MCAMGACDTAIIVTSWFSRWTTKPSQPSAIAEQAGQPAVYSGPNMKWYIRSCERPRNRSASEAPPSSVSNRYSLSTRTHGSSCRRRASSSLRRVSSFSASSSSSRAASHSLRVPVTCFVIALVSFFSQTADSAADRLPDAAEMLVDVAEEGTLDHLLGAHRGHPREHGAGLRELGIGEATYGRGRRRGSLLMERDRLRLRAAGELLGMLGVHLVEHLGGEVRQRLAGGDRLDDVGDRLVAPGDVVRCHCDRPLLACRLLPVGIAQLLEKSRGLPHLGLELLGERFSLGSHGVLLSLFFTV